MVVLKSDQDLSRIPLRQMPTDPCPLQLRLHFPNGKVCSIGNIPENNLRKFTRNVLR
jgi:hypothetical protein